MGIDLGKVMAGGNELSALGNNRECVWDLLVKRLVQYSLDVTRADTNYSQACDEQDEENCDLARVAFEKANFELFVTRLAMWHFDQQGGQQ